MLEPPLQRASSAQDSFAARFLIPLSWQTRHQYLEFAATSGFGVEILAFCSGPALNDPEVRQKRTKILKQELRGYGQPLAFHGAFIDIALHSIDSSIATASRQRIERDLATACELGCEKITFHTGFNPHVPVPRYRNEFVDGHSEFWADVIARFPSITVCLENTYEPDTMLLRKIMRNVGNSRCRVCLDVAHANVFGREVPERWFGRLAPWIAHMHWNDNRGDLDNHLPIGDGLIHWPAVWDKASSLRGEVTITLELGSLQAIRRSLRHLGRLGIWTDATPARSAA